MARSVLRAEPEGEGKGRSSYKIEFMTGTIQSRVALQLLHIQGREQVDLCDPVSLSPGFTSIDGVVFEYRCHTTLSFLTVPWNIRVCRMQALHPSIPGKCRAFKVDGTPCQDNAQLNKLVCGAHLDGAWYTYKKPDAIVRHRDFTTKGVTEYSDLNESQLQDEYYYRPQSRMEPCFDCFFVRGNEILVISYASCYETGTHSMKRTKILAKLWETQKYRFSFIFMVPENLSSLTLSTKAVPAVGGRTYVGYIQGLRSSVDFNNTIQFLDEESS